MSIDNNSSIRYHRIDVFASGKTPRMTLSHASRTTSRMEKKVEGFRLKRLACCLIVLALILGMISVAVAQEVKDGVYTASAAGNNGDVTVSVDIQSGVIAAVTVTSHNETAGISDPAIERIPKEIVEKQSLTIDAVSGATNTSNAILSAVAQCVTLAGGDPVQFAAGANAEVPEMESIELTADVVVVGGGISGVSAALAAADSGAQVVLFEKQAFLGGSAATAGGNFAVVGSQYEIDAGFDPSIENAMERLRLRAEADAKQSGYPDYARLLDVVTGSADNIAWLESQGMVFGDVMAPGSEMARLRTRVPGGTNNGAQMMKTLTETLYAKGVTVYTECPAVELVSADGIVTGVIAQSAQARITAYAKGGVVLACGGFGQNAEMMEQLIPEYAGAKCTSAVGNTGDGFAMAQSVGAAFYENPWVIAAGPALSASVPGGASVSYTAGLLVNAQGERLINEASQYSVVCNTVAWNDDELFLYDASNAEAAAVLEAAVELGEAFKGETIAELAAVAGMDADKLTATVTAYNGYAAAGEDAQFGKAPDYLKALEVAPFYAARFYPVYMGTLGGVVTDEKAHALNGEGQVSEGLYAVGEMSNRCYYNYGYYSAASLQIYSQMGHRAGADAAARAAM